MRIFIFILFAFLLQSCSESLEDYATVWSNEVKVKIIQDANENPDTIIFDTSYMDITLLKEERKLKFFHLNPKLNSDSTIILYDTAISTFFSKDGDFELIKELCPGNKRSFEGIRYKGRHIGVAEFKYCNGKIKERGCRFQGDVGMWTKYDSSGKIIEQTDYGNVSRLKSLKKIKYNQ
jgi:antitoxin component YwqK of YwqJK toxin-antitoxin module